MGDTAGYSGIWGIQRDTDRRDTAGYGGMDTAAYSGIQRHTAGYYTNILQITG